MLAALLLTVVSRGALAQAQAIYGPTLPIGASAEIGQTFAAIEEPLSQGQFDAAAAKLRLLPSLTVSYAWDDSKIPAGQRTQLAEARDAALKMWAANVPGLSFKKGDKPQIKFSFEPVLSQSEESGMPRGIALFYSDELAKPRLEAVIGLKRGNPLELTNDVSMHNEVVFAVGSYLGVTQTPFGGAGMGRVDFQSPSRSSLTAFELGIVSHIQEAAKELTLAVKKKRKLFPTRPRADVEPKVMERGPVVQGTPIEFSIQLYNSGQGPLVYQVVPDCGCISVSPGGTLTSNSAGKVSVWVNTAEIAGEFSKHLLVITNDVENPIQKVLVKVKTIPRYRFLSDVGPVAIVSEDSGLDMNLYLVTPTGNPLKIESLKTTGNPATATFEPWKGDLADPDLNETSKPREGYRIKIHVGQPEVSGRSALGIIVKTSDPVYSELRYTVFVQKGIAVLPGSLYFGEIGKEERRGTIVLTRPGKPFKVTNVEVDSANVTAKATMTRGDWEYRIAVTYNGKSEPGDLRATITVTTDDPKQGKIRIPVTAIVK